MEDSRAKGPLDFTRDSVPRSLEVWLALGNTGVGQIGNLCGLAICRADLVLEFQVAALDPDVKFLTTRLAAGFLITVNRHGQPVRQTSRLRV